LTASPPCSKLGRFNCTVKLGSGPYIYIQMPVGKSRKMPIGGGGFGLALFAYQAQANLLLSSPRDAVYMRDREAAGRRGNDPV